MLYVFKEQDPRMSDYAGREKVFYHTVCTGNEYSYDVDKINSLFEERDDIDSLLARMVIMMEYLQDGYHSGEYPGPAGLYIHAHDEYPEKYLLLVEGLSERALEVMDEINVSKFSMSEPSDLAQQYVHRLREDREMLTQQFKFRPDLKDVDTLDL